LLGLGLRAHGIGRQSLWFDEAATVHIINRPLPRMMELIRSDERTPPAHYLLLHFWVKLFGDSETSVRMPSAIAGTAAIWFLFALTARLANPLAGMIAALLSATSSYQIWYSQEARAYALMLMLGLWSCDLFVRLIETRSARREGAYVIVTALLLYTHLYGIFVILAQHIAYACAGSWSLKRPRHASAGITLTRWILLNVAVLALFSPWIGTAIAWTRSVNAGFWIAPMTPLEIGSAFHLYTGSWWSLGVLIASSIIGIILMPHRKRLILLIALATVPVVIPVIVSWLTHPSFTERYAIIAPAALEALAGIGIAAIGLAFVQVLFIIAFVALAFALPAHMPPKPQWRQAGRYLDSHMRAGDLAVVTRKNATYLYDYYVHRADVRRLGFDGTALPLSLPIEPSSRHIWLVVHSDLLTPAQILDRATWARIDSRRHFRGVDVFELEQR
jgi:hypothetical protein